MKAVFAIALVPVLAACGGSGSSDPVIDDDDELIAAFNPDGPVVNACDSNYYTELTGTYDGQISYTSDDETLSCVWEVDLQIADQYLLDPTTRTVCDLTMNMASTSSNPVGCDDVGLAGDITEPFKGAANAPLWSSAPFPIEANSLLNVGLPSTAVFPIGKEGAASVLTFIFDGQGNVTYPEASDGSWSGVLVKQ